ncbi:unnamed protein product, partial [Ectocarpus sp. 12 AP-2014]
MRPPMSLSWSDHTFDSVLFQPHGVEQHRGLLNMSSIPTKYENASVFHQTEWVDVDTISINLAGNVVIFLLALTFFWSSRRHYPSYFSSKRYYLPDQTPPDLPSSGFISWIMPLMAFPEDDILMYAGFDAAIFLRFYAVAFKVFALFAPYGILVLIPVNVMETPSDSNQARTNINTFNRLSMSNVQHYNPCMWLHALGMYLLSALAMYFLVVEYRYYTNLRHRFLRRKSAHLRTIVVQGVPREMRSDSKLFTYFNTLYPEEVVNVHIPQNLSHLRGLIRERQAVLENLGKGLAEKGVRGEEQYHYTGVLCYRRKRVNTVGFCSTQLDRLNLAIATEQDQRIPRSRRRFGGGPAVRSISSVDMSYDLGTKPNREAGPIERVVLQERSDEDDDGDVEGGPAEQGPAGEGLEGEEEEVGLLDMAEQGWEEGVDRPADDGSGGGGGGGGGGLPIAGTRTAGSDEGGTGVGLRVDRKSAAAAMAEAEARTDAARSSQFGAMEGSGGRGEPGGAMATGGRRKLEEAVEGGGAEVVSRLEYNGNGKKTMQQYQEEYWGKGHQAGEGGGGGGGGGGSAGGAGWGTTTRPSMAPRLSVDLINVDPVKELVKMTAQQTLHTMRAKSLHYRRARGAGYGTAAVLSNHTPPKGGGGGGGGSINSNGSSLNSSGKVGGGVGNGLSPKSTPGAEKTPTDSSWWRRCLGRDRAGAGGVRGGTEMASLLPPSQQHQQDDYQHYRQRRPMTKKGKGYSSRAFVTFRSFGAATVARQVLHCARPGRMAASSAPEPRDVYWPNAIVTRRQHTARRVCVEILLAVLMLLFPVLVTLLSFVFSAENLMQRSEVVKNLCRRSSLFESVVELTQPMAVITVMATLPLLLRWVGHFEASEASCSCCCCCFCWCCGNLAESWIQMQTLSRYFTFQVLNVFLVTTVAGFAVEILTQQLHAQIVRRLMDDPSVLFTLLGETLPKV